MNQKPVPDESAQESSSGRAQRYLGAVAVTAWVAGIASAIAAAAGVNFIADGKVDAPEVGVVLAPVVFGIVNVLVILLGELWMRRRLGQLRRATLVRRTLGDTVSSRLLKTGAASTILLIAVVVAGIMLADPTGRALGYGTPEAHRLPVVSHFTGGVFPGYKYGIPLIAATVLLLVVCAAALRVIRRRSTVQDVDADTAFRKLSGNRVVRAFSAALIIASGGLTFLAGIAIAESFAGRVISAGGLVLTFFGAVLFVGGLLLSAPTRRRSLRSAER